jgi:hypothetical protein
MRILMQKEIGGKSLEQRAGSVGEKIWPGHDLVTGGTPANGRSATDSKRDARPAVLVEDMGGRREVVESTEKSVEMRE